MSPYFCITLRRIAFASSDSVPPFPSCAGLTPASIAARRGREALEMPPQPAPLVAVLWDLQANAAEERWCPTRNGQ